MPIKQFLIFFVYRSIRTLKKNKVSIVKMSATIVY